ncbi:unnamed protein product [Rangifer tarandus platyrhynchus]|uniref:Uncharacterized protein n=1 Tax=Rangifer tarandus platyrhynchus TaxID=3082113 RepID=A0ABN8Y0P0_RANTA|nr:unnamed protein product [Rangifer tarandus platyrhynchus]
MTRKPLVMLILGFPHSSVGKETACNAGDLGLIPGLGRSPGEGNATHSSTLAWRIPWTEDPGEPQSIGLQESDMTEQLNHHDHVDTGYTHTHTHTHTYTYTSVSLST